MSSLSEWFVLWFFAGQFCACLGTEVEVVLAHFSEDLSWMDSYDRPGVRFQVYSKAKVPPPGSVTLPNIGRESHTYLWHIVKNYQSLSQWTVFTQGVRPSWGYHGGGNASGHLSDNVEFADYMQPFPDGRDSFFVLNSASHFPSSMQTNRLGFMIKNLKGNVTSKAMCPHGGADSWTPWWWDKQHPQLWAKASDVTMLQFYHRFIARDDSAEVAPLTLLFAQGARFAVSRERIHARPREYYAALLAQLSHSAAPMEGYWMEASWYDVFHPEALQSKRVPCTLPPVPPQKDALTISAMQAAIVRRASQAGLLDEQGDESGQGRILSVYSVYYGGGNGISSLAAPTHLGLPALLAMLALVAAPLRST